MSSEPNRDDSDDVTDTTSQDDDKEIDPFQHFYGETSQTSAEDLELSQMGKNKPDKLVAKRE